MFDAHIHYYYGPSDTPQEFLKKAASANINGGIIFTVAPEKTIGRFEGDYRWEARMEHLLEFTSQTPGFYPFFWINPTAEDFEKQIAAAVDKGFYGFKIICENYPPEACLPACRVIAQTGKPVMFHTGILGSSRDRLATPFTKPSLYEIMFSVKDLHFSLAHLGWPWMDDYMAMVSKAFFTEDEEFNNKIYYDLAPGTPGINREDGLRKLYLTAYLVKKRVLWGTDSIANDYDPRLPLYWQERDYPIMQRITADAEIPRQPFDDHAPDLSDIWELATEKNWRDFLGIDK